MRWFFAAALALFVASCGQKGPLHLPEEPCAACTPASTTSFTSMALP